MDTQHIVVKKGMASGLSFVVVNKADGTRTCISTPIQEELIESELNYICLDDTDFILSGIFLIKGY